MPIICQLCQQSFDKLISSSHLKYSHKLSSQEYRQQFGEDSLASNEYRAQRSAERSGPNNGMFGKNHSQQVKKSISDKNSNKIPHNKGKKVTDEIELATIKEAVRKREQNYKDNDNHPRKGSSVSIDTRSKISQSVSQYAQHNPDEIKERASRILQTKLDNGYFEEQRQATIDRHIKKWLESDYDLIHEDNGKITIKHLPCGNVYERSMGPINPTTCSVCYPALGVSAAELEIREWLKSQFDLKFIWSDKSVLDNGFEIDVWIPEKRIGIEYNGLYWHSESAGKTRWYHRQKLDKCGQKGIRLIQIFEDEWLSKKSIVQERLRHILGSNQSHKIAARKCQIRSISSGIAREFENQHHVQGAGQGTIAYGLYYQDQIVAVMDFGKLSRAKGQTNTAGSFELTRFCSINSVVGGAGKLFRAFLKEYNPTTVISYSDKRWNTGNLYQKLGFALAGSTVPNYWYVKGVQRYYRYQFRKDRLVAQGHDPNSSEREIMTNLGYKIIWDCGSDKWIWNKKAEQ